MKKNPHPTQGKLYKRGSSQVYHYSFSFDGKQIRGSTGHTVKHKAQAVMDRVKQRYISLIDPPDPRNTTIGLILNLAEGHAKDKGDSTRMAYMVRLRNLRSYLPLDMPASLISNRVIKDYISIRRKLKPDVKNNTLNQELMLVTLGCKLALKDRLIPSIPIFDRLPKDPPRDRFINEDTMKRIREHLPEHLKNLLSWCFYSGMRKNEALHMQWSWISREQTAAHVREQTGTSTNHTSPLLLTVPSRYTKNKRTKKLYLVDVLLPPILGQQGLHEKWIWYNPNTGGRIIKFDRTWHASCIKANEAGLRWHDLKQSAVHFWRVNRKLDESTVMSIVGNVSRDIFDTVYNQIKADDVLQIMTENANTKLTQSDNVVKFNK